VCDSRIREQALNKRPDHGSAESLIQRAGMSEELVDSAHTGIVLVRPPAIA